MIKKNSELRVQSSTRQPASRGVATDRVAGVAELGPNTENGPPVTT